MDSLLVQLSIAKGRQMVLERAYFRLFEESFRWKGEVGKEKKKGGKEKKFADL